MTLTVRSATVSGATTKGSALTHAELDENFNHLSQSSNHTFTQSGTAPTTRTMQAKARDIIASEDHADVGNSIAAAGQAGGVYVPVDKDLGSAREANLDGAYFWGPGKLQYNVSAVLGDRVQNPTGRDRLAWGSEYLYRWIHKVANQAAATVRISGDSTATNLGTAITPMFAAFTNITLTTSANSGESSQDWVDTRLAADITAAPDLLIWHWGMNDTDLDVFRDNLDSGLTTYRASVPIGTGGVLLMTPNASSDGTNGKDELRNEKIRAIIRAAAEKHLCAYLDTYGLFQDGYVGIGGSNDWLDDIGSGRGVHPQPEFARAIAGEVLNVVIPPGVQKYFAPGGVSNVGNTDHAAAAADLITSYPKGISLRRALASNGWPVDGFVMTVYQQDGAGGLQIHWANNNSYSGIRIRKGASTTWQAWTSGSSPFANPTSPAVTDALSTYPEGFSVSRATTANSWGLDGYVWTFRQSIDGNYGYQELHEYNTTAPMLRRQWINTGVAGWGVFRQIGSGNSTTQTGATYTVAVSVSTVIANGSATLTLTLPTASSWTGREIRVVNWVAFTVVSASSNVVPLASGAAGTAILDATAGKWAVLKSDGTNWNIVAAN
jgi:hypothetical protein